MIHTFDYESVFDRSRILQFLFCNWISHGMKNDWEHSIGELLNLGAEQTKRITARLIHIRSYAFDLKCRVKIQIPKDWLETDENRRSYRSTAVLHYFATDAELLTRSISAVSARLREGASEDKDRAMGLGRTGRVSDLCRRTPARLQMTSLSGADEASGMSASIERRQPRIRRGKGRMLRRHGTLASGLEYWPSG